MRAQTNSLTWKRDEDNLLDLYEHHRGNGMSHDAAVDQVVIETTGDRDAMGDHAVREILDGVEALESFSNPTDDWCPSCCNRGCKAKYHRDGSGEIVRTEWVACHCGRKPHALGTVEDVPFDSEV